MRGAAGSTTVDRRDRLPVACGFGLDDRIVEPRAGGRWYTRHQDGTETSTTLEGYAKVADRAS